MYAGFPSEEDLKRISGTGFNCLMPYFLYGQPIEAQKKYLEDSECLGIKTIYSTKDLYEGSESDWVAKGIGRWKGKEAILRGLVETFRSSPNIVAWYANDEMPVERMAELVVHYNITRSLDADHPVWMVHYRFDQMRQYWPTADVFGIDSYPIAWEPINHVVRDVGSARSQLFSARPMWDAPQAHNLQIYNPGATSARPPTYQEMRNMAYQFLCSGATGLVFFCYDDLKRDPKATFEERWRDVKKVAAELHEISPILLSVERPRPIRVEGPQEVGWFQRTYHKVTHVFLVNSGDTPLSARLMVPDSGLQVKVDGVARDLPGDARAVRLDLPVLGICHVEIPA
jgi:hypothetical protein